MFYMFKINFKNKCTSFQWTPPLARVQCLSSAFEALYFSLAPFNLSTISLTWRPLFQPSWLAHSTMTALNALVHNAMLRSPKAPLETPTFISTLCPTWSPHNTQEEKCSPPLNAWQKHCCGRKRIMTWLPTSLLHLQYWVLCATESPCLNFIPTGSLLKLSEMNSIHLLPILKAGSWIIT